MGLIWTLRGLPTDNRAVTSSSFESHTSPARLSDAERDRVLGLLREGAAQGKLSHDTFMRRMELALAARRSDELAVLTADLETGGRWSKRLFGAVGGMSAFTVRLRKAWQFERLPKLLLPATGPGALRIGRDPGNGLRLNHETVSRMHAELSRHGAVWILRDLGSTNGTCVNGQRVTGTVVVHEGDQVSFGRMNFRLTAPAPQPPSSSQAALPQAALPPGAFPEGAPQLPVQNPYAVPLPEQRQAPAQQAPAPQPPVPQPSVPPEAPVPQPPAQPPSVPAPPAAPPQQPPV